MITELIEKYFRQAGDYHDKAMKFQHEKNNLRKAGKYFALYNQTLKFLYDLRKLDETYTIVPNKLIELINRNNKEDENRKH